MILKQLRIFLAVVEAGTVRQAAGRLNLSQSSVTKCIQQLEQELRVELFSRSAQGVALTDAGRLLVARARAIEAELRHARNEIDAFNDAEVGDVRVCASPAVAMGLLPRAIASFKKNRRGVRFQVQEGIYPHLLAPLRTGEIDLAIALVPEMPPDEDLTATILLRDSVIPAVRGDHPLRRRAKVSLADLRDLEWVVYRSSRTGRDIFDRCFAINGLPPPERVIECASFSCTLALIELGDCATLLPSQIFAQQTHRAGVSPLFMETPMPRWDVAVIRRANFELSPVGVAFVDELHRVAEEIQTSAN